MAAFTDITGQRFGRLVAVREAGYRCGHRAWLWHCDCGTEKIIRVEHVKRVTRSCGCQHRKKTHGQSHTRLWAVWKAMKQRCDNPNVASYHRYGGRGITYDPAWASYETFAEWALSHGYADELELDRVDNDGDYTPGNCQFLTHRKNSQKTCQTRMVEYDGKSWPIFELARHFGLETNTLRTRLRRGWSVERALVPSTNDRKERSKCG